MPKARRAEGETVLMTASRTGNVDAMRVLLVRGADPNAQRTWYGETALIWAAAENHAAAGAPARSKPARRSTSTGKKMVFPRKVGGQTTLPVGAMTPLMYTARQGAIDAARALVESGADLNIQDPDGTTAMVLAIINGHYDVAAMLVEKGADPNVADSSGMAALYAAVDMNTLPFMHGRPEPKPSGRLGIVDIVKVLLAHGADVNQQLKTPLLRRHNNTSTQSLGEGTTPLMRAAASGDVTLMRLLLEHGADPAHGRRTATTMLMLAAGFGRRGDHNADAQEYERGTPEELLRAAEIVRRGTGPRSEYRQRPGRYRAARRAQRRHRAVSRRTRRQARREEQAWADAARGGAGAYRQEQPTASAGRRGSTQRALGRSRCGVCRRDHVCGGGEAGIAHTVAPESVGPGHEHRWREEYASIDVSRRVHRGGSGCRSGPCVRASLHHRESWRLVWSSVARRDRRGVEPGADRESPFRRHRWRRSVSNR